MAGVIQALKLWSVVGTYAVNMLISTDQWFNTLLAGSPDETLSARAWRCRDKRRWHVVMCLIETLFFWELAHCEAAYHNELTRRQMPDEYRTTP